MPDLLGFSVLPVRSLSVGLIKNVKLFTIICRVETRGLFDFLVLKMVCNVGNEPSDLAEERADGLVLVWGQKW